MADAINLATAYVQIIPSLKGAAKSIESQLSGVKLGTSGAALGSSLMAGMTKSVNAGSLKSALTSSLSGAADGLRAYRDSISSASTWTEKLKAAAAPAASAVSGMGSAISSAHRSLSSVASSAASAAAGFAKVTAAAGLAAGVGIASITSQAISAYSSYEQLVGGVDTLFGDASDTVQAYAADAYKTAGMSANAYMETVTGFSASLLQGLGGDTAAAAEVANLAVTDMADNANKMGTSMESIQYAYQGFAKQNYTMLDNLKLGYGGTEAEMVRLINDSGVLNETISDMDGVSFDTVIAAIHQVQTNLGITGTTALEASETIEGSVNSAKAAYKNWLTGLADDNADLSALTSQLVDSVATAAGNILPRIGTILQSLASSIAELMPQISAYISESLPGMIGSACEILTSLIPTLMEAAVQLFAALVDALPQILPEVMSALTEVISSAVSLLPTFVGSMLEGAVQLFTALVDALPEILPQLIDAAIQTIDAVIELLPELIPQLMEASVKLFMALVQAVPQILSGLLGAFGNLLKQAVSFIGGYFGEFGEVGAQIINGLIDGIVGMAQGVIDAIGGVVNGAIGWAKSLLGIASPSKVFAEIGGYAMEGMAGGIEDGAGLAVAAMEGAVADVYGAAAGTAHIDVAASDLSATGRSSSAGAVYNVYIDGKALAADPSMASAIDQLVAGVLRVKRMGVA